jgi:hypothetical protein
MSEDDARRAIRGSIAAKGGIAVGWQLIAGAKGESGSFLPVYGNENCIILGQNR